MQLQRFALMIVSAVYLTYKLAIPAPVEYTQLSVSYGEYKNWYCPMERKCP